MSREGGKKKPLKAKKVDVKEQDEDDKAFKEAQKKNQQLMKEAVQRASQRGPLGRGGIKKS